MSESTAGSPLRSTDVARTPPAVVRASAALGSPPVRRSGPGESARARRDRHRARAARWRLVAQAVEWPSARLDRLTLWAWRRHHDASARHGRVG